MENYWDLLTNSFSEYINIFNDSKIYYQNGIDIMNSNSNNPASNLMIIKKDSNIRENNNFISENFNQNGIIFCNSYSITEDLLEIYLDKLSYLGEFPVMKRKEDDLDYRAPHYDNFYITNNHTDDLVKKDFVKLFAELRGIEKENVYISEKDNHHIFLCYMNDKPVGFLYAISFDEDVFVVEANIKQDYQNSGLLTALSKHAKEYAVTHGIYNFYSIATSEHTVSTIMDQGHKMVDSLHIWLVSQ